jgi:hypothetical protein
MIRSTKYFFIFIPLSLLFLTKASASFSKDIFSSFSPSQKSLLKQGKTLQVKKKIKGSSWEKLTFYNIIEVDSYKAAAVFSNIEQHKNFVPNMVRSKIIQKESANFMKVSFKIQTPWPIPDAKYVVTNKINKNKDGSIIVSWKQIESNTMDDNKGFIHFYRLGKNQTFVTYENLIVPSSILAGLFKSMAERDMLASFEVMMKHIKSVVDGKKAGLNRDLKLFDKIYNSL